MLVRTWYSVEVCGAIPHAMIFSGWKFLLRLLRCHGYKKTMTIVKITWFPYYISYLRWRHCIRQRIKKLSENGSYCVTQWNNELKKKTDFECLSIIYSYILHTEKNKSNRQQWGVHYTSLNNTLWMMVSKVFSIQTNFFQIFLLHA